VNEDPDAPPCENEEEIITDVVLTWTPVSGGNPIVARAQDPDGEGPQDLQILDDIELLESTEYSLSILVRNEIEGEDITEEIMEEDDEHMFFFEWTDGIFDSPSGDGNVDNRADSVHYEDLDENELPVGLSTAWTTTAAMDTGGIFRIVLKHQPGIKSETSTIEDGGTDIDLTWNINRIIVTDVGDLNEDLLGFSVFPNPTQEHLFLEMRNDAVINGELFLYNNVGQLMKRFPSEQQIYVGSLPRGSYVLQLRTGNEVHTQRFVKL